MRIPFISKSDQTNKIARYTREDAKFWVNCLIGSQKHLLPIPTIPERTAAFFSQENPFPLQAIRYNGIFVGCISLTPRTTEPVVELGYYIHPAHSGKKVMQAAGRKLLQYAAKEFGIQTVYSSADIMNPASARVIESLSRETATGEVVKGIKILSWPVEKRVEGRQVESPSQTWIWSI